MGSQRGCKFQVEEITKTSDPLVVSTIQNLIRLGFLTTAEESLVPTEILFSLLDLAYEPTELTPESIGRQRQTLASGGMKVVILCDALEDNNNIAILSKLAENLRSQNILSQTINPFRAIDNPFFRPEILVLCVTSKGSPIENTKKFIGLDDKVVVQVLLPGAKSSMVPITAAPILDFTKGIDEAEIHRFQTVIKNDLEKRGLTGYVKSAC